MFTKNLRLGAVAGAVGGIVLALTLLVAGERSITKAIELEEAAARAAGAPDEPPLFSRTVQIVGGGMGAIVYGLLIGLVFAVVFSAIRHRLALRSDWHRSVLLAAAGFVTIVLVPGLKYPANPPAVGDPETVDRRTALYLVAVVWSIVAAWGAWRLARSLRDRVDEPARLTIAVGAYAALVVAMWALLPGTPDAVTAPASLVFRFRAVSLGGQLALWSTMGTVFGLLAVRDRRPADDLAVARATA